jgi:hypothetical protein
MLAILGWLLGFVLVLLISIPLNGLLISATWGWFVVPITGAREISITQGVGLAMFCSIIGTAATAHLREWKIDNEETDWTKTAGVAFGKVIGVAVIGPILVLALAWIWHALFM